MLTIFSLCLSFAQTLEEKEKELFKKYKVKERTTINYNYVNGVKVSKGVKSSTSIYNSQGLVLSTNIFDKEGIVITSEKFGYDEHENRVLYERQGKRTYKKESEYNDEDNVILETGYDGSSAFKTVYVYSTNNKVSYIKYYDNNTLGEKRVYEYTGAKAKVKILDRGKYLKSTIQLSFNAKNQIIEEIFYSLEGAELEKRTIAYNSKGQIQKEEKFRKGKLAYRLTYHYNANNEMVKLTEESPSKGKLDKKLYSYDNMSRVVEYKWKRKPAEEYNVKTYKYGANGVCVEEFTHYPNSNYKILSKYEYKFY